MAHPTRSGRVKARWVIAVAAGVALVWLMAQFALPPAPPPLPGDVDLTRAVWADVTWSMDAHTDDEITALAAELSAHRVSAIFLYTSYLKAGNTFNPTYEHAAQNVRRLRQAAPGLHILAWVGVPVGITQLDGAFVSNRLADEAVRQLIAAFSRRAVVELGFDGVHLDPEPVSDGDPALIETLATVRAALPATATLSLATHALHPYEPVTAVPYPKLPTSWSPEYLRRVAERCDEIAVMAYDSGLFLPSDYRSWMAFQIRATASALEDVGTRVLIGVPASEEWTLTHNTTTEYLANALYGVRLGLSQANTPAEIDGLALYPHWEVSLDEWRLIDDFER